MFDQLWNMACLHEDQLPQAIFVLNILCLAQELHEWILVPNENIYSHRAELETKYTTDPFIDVLNRRRIVISIARQLQKSKKQQQPIDNPFFRNQIL